MNHAPLIFVALFASSATAGPPAFSHFDVEGLVSVPTGLWVLGVDDCDEGGRRPVQYWLGSAPRPAGDAPKAPPPVDAASRGDTTFIVGNGGSIRESRDAGKTWIANASGTHRDLHAVWIHSANEVYAVGDHATLLVKRGTTAWTPIELPTHESTDLRGIWGIGNDLYAIGMASFASHDGGATWQVLPALLFTTAISGVSDTEVYAAGWHGIRVTHDHGKTWNRVLVSGRKCDRETADRAIYSLGARPGVSSHQFVV